MTGAPAASCLRSVRRCAAAATLASALLAGHASAQVIRGTVRDEATKQPLPGATVSILDERDSALRVGITSDSGRFSFTLPSAGSYAIDIRRLGYTELNTTKAALAVGDTVTIALELGAQPVHLDTVYTKARPDSSFLTKVTPGHVVVAEHYKEGKGLIISGYMMEKSGKSLSEYLSHAPGVRLSGVKPPGIPVLPGENGHFLTSNLASQCVYARVDHWPILFLMIQGWAATIDEVLPPKSVMAVEFYRSAAEVPKEWLTDAALTELETRSYSLTFTYTGTDRYTIGSNLPMGQLQIQEDTVYNGTFTDKGGAGGHAGYGAIPNALDAVSVIPICGFIQIWTKAAW